MTYTPAPLRCRPDTVSELQRVGVAPLRGHDTDTTPYGTARSAQRSAQRRG